MFLLTWIGLALIVVSVPQLAAGDEPSALLMRVDESQYTACGPCCLYMACVMTGHDVEFEALMGSFEPDSEGETSLAELDRVARSVGLIPVAAAVEPEWLDSLPCPFIAHVDLPAEHVDHFVLVVGVTNREVIYVDPPLIAALELRDTFSKRWTGNVLAFADSEEQAALLEQAIRQQSWTPLPNALLVTTLVGMTLVGGHLVKKNFTNGRA